MGLDFSHGDVSFAYSGFAEFRRKIAKQLGFDIDKREGFGGTEKWPSPVKDPIDYLLDHSDCEGQISAKRCAKIAVRLREIAKDWDGGKYGPKEKAYRLADALEEAAEANEPFEFM